MHHSGKTVTRRPFHGTGAIAGLCLFILLGPGTAWASERQSHEAILEAARSLLAAEASSSHPDARIEIETGRLDPRLLLPACPAPLEAFRTTSTPPAGNLTVGVRCPSGTGWTVYAPATVSVHVPVVVLARAQTRGAILTSDDIRIDERNIGALSGGYLLDPSRALGMELRRNLPVGTVLTANAVTAARIIQRGQSVTLIAEGASVTVRMNGEALEDGTAGTRIRVRNLSSKRVVEGVVDGPGIVRIAM